MKKWLSIILASVVFLASFLSAGAAGNDSNFETGFEIIFNGEVTNSVSVISGDAHYVPMRMIFEKIGASVFYRNRDGQILVLTRDGDVLSHIVGSNIVFVNGEEKFFEKASLLEDGRTYLPVDMLPTVLCPNAIFFDNSKLIIQKQIHTFDYHKAVEEVLNMRKSSDFHPERFREYINYHRKMPSCSIDEVIFRVNLGLDYPFYENADIIENPYELSVLVNKYNQLPSDFVQYNLVNMAREHTANDGKAYLIESTAYEKYIQMSDAAKRDGISMRVVSAYRTEDYQRNLYNNRVITTGKVNADNYTARPGFSEHQTGLAVDISSTKVSFEYSAEFKWLKEHAHEYGYILRYPKGKEWITGYAYEPWHYRYVGTDAAKIIYEEGITYEEFYEKYVLINEFM